MYIVAYKWKETKKLKFLTLSLPGVEYWKYIKSSTLRYSFLVTSKFPDF